MFLSFLNTSDLAKLEWEIFFLGFFLSLNLLIESYRIITKGRDSFKIQAFSKRLKFFYRFKLFPQIWNLRIKFILQTSIYLLFMRMKPSELINWRSLPAFFRTLLSLDLLRKLVSWQELLKSLMAILALELNREFLNLNLLIFIPWNLLTTHLDDSLNFVLDWLDEPRIWILRRLLNLSLILKAAIFLYLLKSYLADWTFIRAWDQGRSRPVNILVNSRSRQEDLREPLRLIYMDEDKIDISKTSLIHSFLGSLFKADESPGKPDWVDPLVRMQNSVRDSMYGLREDLPSDFEKELWLNRKDAKLAGKALLSLVAAGSSLHKPDGYLKEKLEGFSFNFPDKNIDLSTESFSDFLAGQLSSCNWQVLYSRFFRQIKSPYSLTYDFVRIVPDYESELKILDWVLNGGDINDDMDNVQKLLVIICKQVVNGIRQVFGNLNDRYSIYLMTLATSWFTFALEISSWSYQIYLKGLVLSGLWGMIHLPSFFKLRPDMAALSFDHEGRNLRLNSNLETNRNFVSEEYLFSDFYEIQLGKMFNQLKKEIKSLKRSQSLWNYCWSNLIWIYGEEALNYCTWSGDDVKNLNFYLGGSQNGFNLNDHDGFVLLLEWSTCQLFFDTRGDERALRVTNLYFLRKIRNFSNGLSNPYRIELHDILKTYVDAKVESLDLVSDFFEMISLRSLGFWEEDTRNSMSKIEGEWVAFDGQNFRNFYLRILITNIDNFRREELRKNLRKSIFKLHSGSQRIFFQGSKRKMGDVSRLRDLRFNQESLDILTLGLDSWDREVHIADEILLFYRKTLLERRPLLLEPLVFVTEGLGIFDRKKQDEISSMIKLDGFEDLILIRDGESGILEDLLVAYERSLEDLPEFSSSNWSEFYPLEELKVGSAPAFLVRAFESLKAKIKSLKSPHHRHLIDVYNFLALLNVWNLQNRNVPSQRLSLHLMKEIFKREISLFLNFLLWNQVRDLDKAKAKIDPSLWFVAETSPEVRKVSRSRDARSLKEKLKAFESFDSPREFESLGYVDPEIQDPKVEGPSLSFPELEKRMDQMTFRTQSLENLEEEIKLLFDYQISCNPDLDKRDLMALYSDLFSKRPFLLNRSNKVVVSQSHHSLEKGRYYGDLLPFNFSSLTWKPANSEILHISEKVREGFKEQRSKEEAKIKKQGIGRDGSQRGNFYTYHSIKPILDKIFKYWSRSGLQRQYLSATAAVRSRTFEIDLDLQDWLVISWSGRDEYFNDWQESLKKALFTKLEAEDLNLSLPWGRFSKSNEDLAKDEFHYHFIRDITMTSLYQIEAKQDVTVDQDLKRLYSDWHGSASSSIGYKETDDQGQSIDCFVSQNFNRWETFASEEAREIQQIKSDRYDLLGFSFEMNCGRAVSYKKFSEAKSQDGVRYKFKAKILFVKEKAQSSELEELIFSHRLRSDLLMFDEE